MISLTILYDEYIDRSNITELKNQFEYIVLPPLRGVGTIKLDQTEYYLFSGNIARTYLWKKLNTSVLFKIASRPAKAWQENHLKEKIEG